MMRRKPLGRGLRATLWSAAALVVLAVAAVLLLPRVQISIRGGDAAPAAAADKPAVNSGDAGKSDDNKTDDNAAPELKAPNAAPEPEHEDALRSHDRRDDEAAGESQVKVMGGYTVLQLKPDVQERSGLHTEILKPVTFAPEIDAFGRVVDIQPLLSDRGRYTAAQGRAEVARATLNAAKAEYDRLAALQKDEGDVATKRVQEAEAEWKREQAEVRSAEADMAAVRDDMRQQWGSVIASWALDGSSPELEHLLSHEHVLLLVTLPPGQTLPPDTQTAQVARNGNRAGAVAATFVSPAHTADATVQGETYYFHASAADLRAGMRVDVWIQQSKNAAAGVIVPQSAVVWAMGEAWAYIQIDNTHFVRRPVSTKTEAPGGWFVSDAIKPGDTVVIAGAQMLYADEFRWQIRDQDN